MNHVSCTLNSTPCIRSIRCDRFDFCHFLFSKKFSITFGLFNVQWKSKMIRRINHLYNSFVCFFGTQQKSINFYAKVNLFTVCTTGKFWLIALYKCIERIEWRFVFVFCICCHLPRGPFEMHSLFSLNNKHKSFSYSIIHNNNVRDDVPTIGKRVWITNILEIKSLLFFFKYYILATWIETITIPPDVGGWPKCDTTYFNDIQPTN